MKQVICEEFAPVEALKVVEVPSPEITETQVLVTNEAVGVNFPDGLLVQGLYQARPPRPFTPGIEVAGVVKAIGADVKNVKVGDRVAAVMPIGGYAEEVVIEAVMAMPLPDGVPAVDATALLCAYGTSHHGLKQRANLQAGESVLVLGAAGSTGIAAIEIAKAMGATVTAVASTQEKLDIAKAHGADVLILNDDKLAENVKEAAGKGFDVIYDPIGGDAFDICVRRLAWNGRYLVVGFAAGRIPELPVNLILVKGCSVMGVFWGTFTQKQPQDYLDNQTELFQWYLEGKVKPHIHKVYSMDNVHDALNDVLQRKVAGKVVLKP
ncbi:NADPH:quinone oxidoreductase family protein [Oceaniserpentilla sp. 4NH20-0058]|uniref:NADPH:quinone oxidoreductase family protein n=1 Tax=Oceaniserpentilla sp. 4NH20-0058 TaxID=3127660 RepID=UPI00310A1846